VAAGSYDVDPNRPYEAFIVEGGHVARLNFGWGTYLNAINDRGTAVGDYADKQFITHGLEVTNNQVTTLDDPDAVASGGSTIFNAINNRGAVAGDYIDASNGQVHGFLLTQ
jgi:hypothetical protein